jgi:hypothetical protein
LLNRQLKDCVPQALADALGAKQLQKQLTESIEASVSNVVTNSFQQKLIPAYQSATQSMFKQMHSALENSVKEGSVFVMNSPTVSKLNEWDLSKVGKRNSKAPASSDADVALREIKASIKSLEERLSTSGIQQIYTQAVHEYPFCVVAYCSWFSIFNHH